MANVNVNFEIELCYVEINIDQEILPSSKSPNPPIYIGCCTYRQTSLTLLAATNGEWTNAINLRFTSMNSIFARFRNFASAGNGASGTAAYRLSSSINPNISNYYI